MISSGRRYSSLFRSCTILLTAFLALALGAPGSGHAAETTAHDPWNNTQLIMPEDLAKILSGPSDKNPVVICVGFEFLYKGAHIPGAQFIGPGRDPKGIEALKTWARGIRRDSDVVIYCGCCPFKECPNIRPAFAALREIGLTHLKVLDLKTNFAEDWAEKGRSVEKGAGGK